VICKTENDDVRNHGDHRQGGPDEYAENIAPLIVSPDIEQFSGAMFNKRGEAIQPSPAMTDNAHVRRFMEASEQLARKALPCVNSYRTRNQSTEQKMTITGRVLCVCQK
jgi:hypothetical protein